MACREIDTMRQQVCNSLHSNVEKWRYDLQARWGDPRVYAAQQAAMRSQDAALAHDLSRRNEKLLEDAYAKQAQKNREEHNTRRAKSRLSQKSDTPPESAAAQPTPTSAPRRAKPATVASESSPAAA